MRNLLYKELKLAMHPTMLIFILFAGFLIIPSYPYYVTFFYISLAVFFTCLSGRENNDIPYSMGLPVDKKSIAHARVLFCCFAELALVLFCIPFALLRFSFADVPANEVGMMPTAAFFGLALIMIGIFNFLFFTNYYKNPQKVGVPFFVASIAEFAFIIIAEALVHIPAWIFKDCFNAPFGECLPVKFAMLAIGIVVFALLSFFAARIGGKRLEKYDL